MHGTSDERTAQIVTTNEHDHQRYVEQARWYHAGDPSELWVLAWLVALGVFIAYGIYRLITLLW